MDFDDKIIANAPIFFLKINEESGAVATDYSGNNKHGTIVGTPQFSQDGIGFYQDEKTIAFNALGRITLPHEADFNNDGSITVEAIVKPVANDLSGAPMIVCKGVINSSWLLFLQGGLPYFRITASTQIGLGTSLTAGYTYYLAGIDDGSSIKIYQYNFQTDTWTSNSLNTAVARANDGNDIGIGASYGGGNPFRGIVNRVAFHQQALSETVIFQRSVLETFDLIGTVKDNNNNPLSRRVIAFRRVNDTKIGTTQSDAGDGSFTIQTNFQEAHYIIALDDDQGTQENAIVFDRVIPI